MIVPSIWKHKKNPNHQPGLMVDMSIDNGIINQLSTGVGTTLQAAANCAHPSRKPHEKNWFPDEKH